MEPTGKPKVIYTDNSLEFGKACEDLSWRPHTVQKHIGLLRGQYAELKKGRLLYCCNQVWMKNGGRIAWNATAICEILKIISCLTGKHRVKNDLKNRLRNRLFHLVHCLIFILYPRKASRESTTLVTKYFTWNIPPIRLVRGWNLERRHYGCGP